MEKIVSRVVKLKIDKMPPSVDFIEKELSKYGEIVRWAIVEVEDNILTLSISSAI